MQWLIMNMTLLSTVPDGKPLRRLTLTRDALFAVWLPSLHSIWRPSISLELSLCILTWIIPHGLNMTNATPHFIFSVGPGNPCRLSEINISYIYFSAADSFRPFPLCVSLAFPVPCFACQCSLFCVSLALKMAQRKCGQIPQARRSRHLGVDQVAGLEVHGIRLPLHHK